MFSADPKAQQPYGNLMLSCSGSGLSAKPTSCSARPVHRMVRDRSHDAAALFSRCTCLARPKAADSFKAPSSELKDHQHSRPGKPNAFALWRHRDASVKKNAHAGNACCCRAKPQNPPVCHDPACILHFSTVLPSRSPLLMLLLRCCCPSHRSHSRCSGRPLLLHIA